jgi:F-type H+-transporting ATPase subunit delta
MSEREAIQTRHETVLDDTARQVAAVYAEALYQAARKQDSPEAILDDLHGLVAEVFDRDPDLETFFASGTISREHKADAIRRAFDGKASPTFVNFLLVLNAHDRLVLLREIAETFRKIHDERTGRMPVVVRSAVPLGDDQLDRLRQELRAQYGKEPVVETRIDPELLGGLVVRVGDWVYDASVKSRLESIRELLTQRSGHEIQSRRDRFSTE